MLLIFFFFKTLPKQELNAVPMGSSMWTSLDFRGHFQIQDAFLLLNRQTSLMTGQQEPVFKEWACLLPAILYQWWVELRFLYFSSFQGGRGLASEGSA